MNKKINLAVAGAVLLAASAANAGIIIPAGEWTLDVNGNVNHFMIFDSYDSNTTAITGGLARSATTATEDATTQNTGLLPSWLGFSGTTRQNDLDVSFTISMQPGTSSNTSASGGSGTPENRQAFITFGDKSWGTVKIGKDLGIFGSDAILSDMTLLGVGSTGLGTTTTAAGTGSGNTTTLGHIGTGYLYADWKAQFAYTTPSINGFQATVGVMQPWNTWGDSYVAATNADAYSATGTSKEEFGYEMKASYTASMGKVWVEYMSQKVDNLTYSAALNKDDTANMIGLGATANFGNLGLAAYYSSGEGVGTTFQFQNGYDSTGEARDSDTAFVQATYVIPTGTKIGVSYGRSDLDWTTADRALSSNNNLVSSNSMWTVGAYHPLTKHLNLVAEYNDSTSETETASVSDVESNSFSLGAILFF